MFTDAPPRKSSLESDRIKTLDLPQNGRLPEIAQRLESAMKSDKIRDVRSACTEFLATASDFHEVPTCTVRVLAARPLRTRERGTFELFGGISVTQVLLTGHTSRSVATIPYTRDIVSKSTGAGTRGRHLPCRTYSIRVRRCKTRGLPCGRSATSSNGIKIEDGPTIPSIQADFLGLTSRIQIPR